ncbi:MAG: fibronectin type III domain-containing protein [Thermoplasmata archaeon]|nr:fibronectin type III domain-containing protein [Thermoplasmata archaeon]
MSRRPPTGPASATCLALVLTLALLIPLGEVARLPSATVAAPAPTNLHPAFGHLVAKAPLESAGPSAYGGNQSVDAKLFRTTQWNSSAAVGYNQIAIDPSRSMVFSVNTYAGTVSSFSAVSLASGPGVNLLANESPSTTEYLPVDIALDSLHHLLDVAEYAYPGNGGRVVELNESTLLPVGTLSLPSTFTPAVLAFDASDGQIVLANATGSIVVLSSDVGTILGQFPSSCTNPQTCYLPQLVPLGGHHEVLAFLGSRGGIQAINTSTLESTDFTTVSGGFSAGAYDRVHDAVWVADLGASQLDRLNPLNGTLETSVPFSSSGDAMAVDPVTGDLLVASTNGSYGQELWEYEYTGGELYHYLNLSSNITAEQTDPSFSELECGEFGTLQLVITAGGLNGTTQEFELLGSVPYAVHYATLASLPWNVIGSAVDPTLGLVYQFTDVPNALTAYWESNGSIAWSDAYTIGYPPDDPGFALDAVSGRLYVVPPTNETLLTLDAGTGHVLATTPTIEGGDYQLAVDPVHDWMYVAGGPSTAAEIQIFSLGSTAPTSLGTIALPGGVQSICELLADSTRGVAYASNCLPPARMYEVSGASLSIVHTFDTGVFAVGQALGPNGDLYYSTYPGSNITVLDPSTNQTVASFSVGVRDVSLTYWPAANLLLGGNYNGTVTVINVTTQTFVGNLTLPGADAYPAFDPTTSTLWSRNLINNNQFEATWIPPPTAATDLVATVGNSSASLTWNGGSTTTGYPITYEVQAHSANGPNVTVNVTGSSTTLPGLADGQSYSVTLTSGSAAGSGGGVGPVNVTPLGAPFPPTLATAVAGNASVAFFWNPPESDDGAPVSNYTVHYTVVGTGIWTVVNAGTTLSTTISGLVNGIPLVVYVQATNSVGTSQSSAEVTVTPEAGPAAPAPAPANNNGPTAGLWVTDALVLGALVVSVVVTWWVARRAPPPPRSALAPAATPPEPPPSGGPPPS